MSIASAITAAQGRVADAYTAISGKGGTLPATQDLTNMPTAINSIPTGGGGVISTLTVTPTTSAQTITASGGVDGFSPVNVSAVTSSIDPNILPENIKSGISILSVLGTYSGGGGGGETVDEWLERVLLGDWVTSTSTYNSKGQTATAGVGWSSGSLQTIDLPNVEIFMGAFPVPSASVSTILMPKLKFITSEIISAYSNPSFANLTSIELPELLASVSTIFYYASALVKVLVPKLFFSKVSYICQYLESLEYLYAPALKWTSTSKSSNILFNCPKIRCIYFRDIISIDSYMTGSTTCSNFDTLILAGDSVVPLTNVNNITHQTYHPKFYNGTGSIYVPDNLVDSYKVATNWSTIAAQIKKLSTWVNPYA